MKYYLLIALAYICFSCTSSEKVEQQTSVEPTADCMFKTVTISGGTTGEADYASNTTLSGCYQYEKVKGGFGLIEVGDRDGEPAILASFFADEMDSADNSILDRLSLKIGAADASQFRKENGDKILMTQNSEGLMFLFETDSGIKGKVAFNH